MSKHFVLSGCSFTHVTDGKTWANFLESHYHNSTVHNMGIGGAGNYLLSCLCISKVDELLSKGVSPEDIFVISQWSGLSRISFIADTSSPAQSIKWSNCLSSSVYKSTSPKDTKFCWSIVPRGAKNKSDQNKWWEKYRTMFWNNERAFVETLENILRVQWFLEKEKVSYLMFNGWDIFTSPEPNKSISEVERSNRQWSNTHAYMNKNYVLLKDIYSWSSHLWDMINMDNYCFFENNDVKYGGLLQFVQHTCNRKDWHVSRHDPHPSEKGHSLFFSDVLMPKIDNIKPSWSDKNV